ncbi:MAG: sodium-translocating pyrophosphatase [Capsulimonadaceae bacterium]|nr:sodium-translocating pyrophosphatase [Capsulimonadaceae bacterium]
MADAAARPCVSFRGLPECASGALERVAAIAFVLAFARGPADAAGEGQSVPFDSSAFLPLSFVLATALIAVMYGFILRARVLALSPGSDAMQRVGQAIRDGAKAYLSKQVRAMLPLVVVICILLFFLFAGQAGYTHTVAIGIAIAFIGGVACSYTAGYVGMNMATLGNQRTANAALTSYRQALRAAFHSGAVAGLMTVGLGLLGAGLIFFIFREDAAKVLIGFGFGGSLAALFMRVGGGIYTKAADVGADLVGKVENDIPEDDPRNPATIADNVGDNVGDCAGMSADVFESYLVTLVATIILGATFTMPIGHGGLGLTGSPALALILFPVLVHAIGILASILGIASVHGSDDLRIDPLKIINGGLTTTALLAVIGFTAAAFLLPQWRGGITVPVVIGSGAAAVISGYQHFEIWRFVLSTLMGVVLALAISWLTEYFTGADKPPVGEVAMSARTGPATLILSGFSIGLESATWGAVAISVVFGVSLLLYPGQPLVAAYGIALSGLGLLTTTGFVLAMDTFGPISDNANGIFEMSGALKEQPPDSHPEGYATGGQVVARLDAAGNTTKAITKGFAISTAVIAAVALFRGFISESGLSGLPIDQPKVFMGLLIGGSAPFLFSSFAINAVARAASKLVLEVRRQFREHPGIMTYDETPDYGRCVEIATSAAQRELLSPGILAICLPILVGYSLGPELLGGYLAGAIISGQLLAVLLANSGGAWDNAKKKIEDGLLGGKGSEAHKAAVIGDTVGDPFKDTAGPALNPLIKVMNLVGVLIAGDIIANIPLFERLAICITMVILLAGAILFSKRSILVNTDVTSAAEPTIPPLPGPGDARKTQTGH